jgi:hypothetical protein
LSASLGGFRAAQPAHVIDATLVSPLSAEHQNIDTAGTTGLKAPEAYGEEGWWPPPSSHDAPGFRSRRRDVFAPYCQK